MEDKGIRTCPCCGRHTLLDPKSGSYEICPVCFWEDDPHQLKDPYLEGGANDASLDMARANYQIYGFSDPKYMDLTNICEEEGEEDED